VAREVRERQTEGGLPYLSFGEGPPLVVAGAAYTLRSTEGSSSCAWQRSPPRVRGACSP
jgi:hypothetical protein